MPLVPERLAARAETRAALDAQFWEQGVACARSLDGVARTAPADPPPLGQLTPQGAARPQQLLIVQAGVGPVAPGYDSSNGGAFVDRVLACVGARRWWATLSGRARVQRLAEAHLAGAPLSVALSDASAYGLSARGRLALGGGAAVSGVVEVPDARWLPSPSGLGDAAWWGGNSGPQARQAAAPRLSPSSQAAAGPRSPSPSPPSPSSSSAAASSYGSAAGSAASPGDAGATSSATPRGRGGGRRKQAAQAQAPPGTPPARRHARGGGAQPPLPSIPLPPPSPAAAPSLADRRSLIPPDLLPRGSAKLTARLPGGHEAAFGVSAGNLYVDAAASTTRVPLVLTADLAALPRDDGIQYRVGVHRVWAPDEDGEEDGAGDLFSEGGAGTSTPRLLASPRAGGAGGSKPPLRSVAHVQGAVAVEGEAVVWQSKRRVAAGVGRGSGGSGPAAGGTGGPAAAWLGEATAKTEPPAPPLLLPSATTGDDDPLAAAVGADWVVDLDAASAVTGPGGGKTKKTTPPPPPASSSPAAAALQARLQTAASAAESARALVGRLDAALRAGNLLNGGQGVAATKKRTLRRPYLPGLGPPRIALSGAVGCLGRMPLPDDLLQTTAGGGGGGPGGRRGNSPARPPGGPAAPSSSASPTRPPPIRTTTGATGTAPAPPPRPWWRPHLPRALDSGAWAPCVRDTALRVFASAGASVQLGTFSRPLADYTYASVRLDAGLTAPGGGGSGGGSGDTAFSTSTARRRPRGGGGAFALEGRGVWHALSASLCQQVVGPLRVRADARLALETASRGGNRGEGGFLPAEAAAPGRPATPPGGGAPWGGAGGASGPPGSAASPSRTSPQQPRRRLGRPPSAAGTAREALREAASRGWAAAKDARPTLLETAYGLDYVLPGTEGSLRLVGWWSPARREGMVELRLL